MFHPVASRLTAAESQQYAAPKPARVPDSVYERVAKSKKLRKYAANMQDLVNDPDRFARHQQEFEELCEQSGNRENPHVERQRLSTTAVWTVQCDTLYSHIPREEHFRDTTVRMHAPKFLHLRLTLQSAGRDQEDVKASTVRVWFSILVYMIARQTFDADGKRNGIAILGREGLWHRLNNIMKQLIENFKLDRYRPPKIRYGRAELQLLIEKCLSSSFSNGRAVNIQLILAMHFGFYLSSRPSSLAASAQAFIDQDKIMKISDIRLFKEGKFAFRAGVHLGNFKAHMDDLAKEQYFWLTPVKRGHNVLFDPGVWLLLHLFFRGALFEETLEEIYASTKSELAIRPEKLNEPLFLQATGGGHRLKEGKALRTTNLSESIRARAAEAGLPVASFTAFRYDAAQFYTAHKDAAFTSNIMGHQLDDHRLVYEVYAQVTQLAPVVAMRVGEDAGVQANSAAESALELSSYTSAAMQALVGRIRVRADPSLPKEGIRVGGAEARKAKAVDPGIQAVVQEKERAWRNFTDVFEPNVRPLPGSYLMGSQNIDKMLADCTLKKRISMEAAKAKGDYFRSLCESKTAKGTRLTSKMRNDKEKDVRRKSQKRAADRDDVPTIEEREAAMLEAKKPSAVLVELAGADSANAPGPSTTIPDPLTAAPSSSATDGSPATRPPLPPQPSASASEQEWRSYASEMEKLAQEDEEDEEVCREIQANLKLPNFVQLGNPEPEAAPSASASSSAPAPVDPGALSEGQVQADDEHGSHEPSLDENEPNPFLNVDVDELRYRLAQYVAAPELFNRAQEKDSKLDDCYWICNLCKRFTHRNTNEKFKGKSNFRKHVTSQHMPWRQLELLMLTDDPELFVCPAGDGFQADDIDEVLEHCLSDECLRHDLYRAMKHEHKITRHSYNNKKKVETRATREARILRSAVGTQETLRQLLRIGSAGFAALARERTGGRLNIADDHYAAVFRFMQEVADGKHEVPE